MNPTKAAVVKLGGRELVDPGSIDRVASWIGARVRAGRPIVVVHGGGDEVTERASALGLPTEKRSGQRVTDAAMLEVVIEVLAGRVNARLVGRLGAHGVPSVGLTGLADRLLLVRPAGAPPGSLGFVGEPVEIRRRLLDPLLAQGITPVIAPIGTDGHGQCYNVNADLAAAAIARSLRADLFLVTDVPGVRDAQGEVLDRLTVAGARRLVRDGIARDGMIPKLEAAEAALSAGSTAWIGDLEGLLAPGRTPGTQLTRAPAAAPTSPTSPTRLRDGGT